MLIVMLALLLLFGPKDAPRILRKGLEALRKVQQSANRFKNDLLSAGIEPDAKARTRNTQAYDQKKASSEPPPGEAPP